MSSSVLYAAPLSAAAEHCTFAVQSIRALQAQNDGFGSKYNWFEVLIRPQGAYSEYSPADFVDRLYGERDTVLTDLEVLQRAVAWVMTRDEPHRISVNTHPQSLTQRRFTLAVLSAQERLAGRGHSLCLELIEYGQCREKNLLIFNAQRIRQAGVLIALDDFGSRINCFDLCAAGIVDLLKVDLRFIDGLEVDSNQRAVVESILSLGRGLGAQVVAEGAETRGQIEALRQMGMDFAQGFYLHKPQRLDI
jgi:EAL domain-containing protein (putative c-di-GMP-specific phosphodiesterase class I)